MIDLIVSGNDLIMCHMCRVKHKCFRKYIGEGYDKYIPLCKSCYFKTNKCSWAYEFARQVFVCINCKLFNGVLPRWFSYNGTSIMMCNDCAMVLGSGNDTKKVLDNG